ncbi:hypothetical protein SAMN05216553_113231 [Lentzea fradiae]|uniref:Uncharacterized protein n=1 Tax=Lentzea fradiae TaxID=200378 RepID=A0A1G7YDA1_9PSEU|nr:hypothetical protein [Lentzea fradiae]SDG94296.1 hypothetical protein SAMN05216553_113231 [Lentzea fradiae]
MRSILLAIVVALCAVLAPAVPAAAAGAPPPKPGSSAPKEEAPREEREPGRVRLLVTSAERVSAVAAPSFVAVSEPHPAPAPAVESFAERIVVWRTPPALQVFRN